MATEDEGNKALTKALLTTLAGADMAVKDSCAAMSMVAPRVRLLYRQCVYSTVVALLVATQNKGALP